LGDGAVFGADFYADIVSVELLAGEGGSAGTEEGVKDDMVFFGEFLNAPFYKK
jgi:hypothetical protein